MELYASDNLAQPFAWLPFSARSHQAGGLSKDGQGGEDSRIMRVDTARKLPSCVRDRWILGVGVGLGKHRAAVAT